MGNEIKNYAIVTFSCRGERYHEIRGHEMGMPMFDWIREKAPVETDRLTRVLEGALKALYQRSRSGIREERGLVNPYLFIINEADGVKLLDLCDQSNMAVVRKSRTGTAMRCFSPSEWALKKEVAAPRPSP